MRSRTIVSTLSSHVSRPALMFGGAALLAGLFALAPAHAQSMSGQNNSAVSHSTRKDAGAAARRQTRMSGHKPIHSMHAGKMSRHHTMSGSMGSGHMTHKTSSRTARKTKLSNTMGHKTAHQNQLEGATTSNSRNMSDQARSTHSSQ